jgi:CPA1 family monovalent cation:H+ antiporter
MPELEQVVLLVVGVVVVNGIAARIRVPSPILLVIAGIAVSFIPAVPTVEVDPDVVLTVLLPPLLYAAAVESSVIAIRRALRAITQLAIGMVLVTAFAVAFVLHALIPEIPFAAAIALGAIVAPPDAVASVAIARKAGLPRTAVTVLEGESLFNDATSLVLLRVAIVGISFGTLAWGSAIGQFAWAAAGGVLIGATVGVVLSLVRRYIGSTLAITALSLVTPWLAFLIGESVSASGVLTVVVTGLVLGFRSPSDLPPEVRLTDGATWNSLQYVLEGSVFALIGLQLWDIVTAPDIGRAPTLLTAAAVLATVILIRPLWIFLGDGVTRLIHRRPMAPWRPLVAISWAGMRGVVSLAAAQTLPLNTPFRPLLLTCTIAVILGTLVVQGLSLPAVIRLLRMPDDPAADTQRERADAREQANQAIAARVEEVIAAEQLPERQAKRMRAWAANRDWRGLTERLDNAGDDAQERLERISGWRHELVGIEREVFVTMRNSGRISEDVLRELQYDLDLEESLLDRRLEDASGHLSQLTAARDDWDPRDDAATKTATLRIQPPDSPGPDSPRSDSPGPGSTGR